MEKEMYSEHGYLIDYSEEEYLLETVKRAEKFGFKWERDVLEVPETSHAYFMIRLFVPLLSISKFECGSFLNDTELRNFLDGVFTVCNLEGKCDFTYIKNPLKEDSEVA